MHKRESVITYNSHLAFYFYKFVDEKHAQGYRFNVGASILRQFDRLLMEHDVHTPDIPKAVLNEWGSKRLCEQPQSQRSRIGIVRQFCTFLARQGFTPNMPPRIWAKSRFSEFVPYIFTNKQIREMLSAADRIQPSMRSPHRKTIFPLVIRILCGCGLRISEVLNLRIEDINMADGVMTIREAKLDNQRLVPVTESLLARLREYATIYLQSKSASDFFFPAPDSGQFHPRVIYDIFRKLLRECGIGHGGPGKGPRLHDLRHTFACHRLSEWFHDGVDAGVALPVLSAYLGHKSIYETQHYLRIIPELYPDLAKTLISYHGDIIPERNH